MTRLLRESAEIREARERARLREDELLARRAATALMDAIRAQGLARLPDASHTVEHDAGRRPGR